jgi:hypothetical protein
MEKYWKPQKDLDESYYEIEAFQTSVMDTDPGEIDLMLGKTATPAKKVEIIQSKAGTR